MGGKGDGTIFRGDEGSCNTHPTSRVGVESLQSLIFLGLSIVGNFLGFALQGSKAPLHPPGPAVPFSCGAGGEGRGRCARPHRCRGPATPPFPPRTNPSVIPCNEALVLSTVPPLPPAAAVLPLHCPRNTGTQLLLHPLALREGLMAPVPSEVTHQQVPIHHQPAGFRHRAHEQEEEGLCQTLCVLKGDNCCSGGAGRAGEGRLRGHSRAGEAPRWCLRHLMGQGQILPRDRCHPQTVHGSPGLLYPLRLSQ